MPKQAAAWISTCSVSIREQQPIMTTKRRQGRTGDDDKESATTGMVQRVTKQVRGQVNGSDEDDDDDGGDNNDTTTTTTTTTTT